ncbi:glycerol-3-phosphate 1-O-acyltransferase PlsY [soil metagenome]
MLRGVRAATVEATGVAVITGYLLGSIPVAVLVGRRHGVDPRRVGDENPGYWNLREHLGARRAAPFFACDVAKGVAAGLVGVGVAPVGAWGVGYAAVGAAMVGHAWPIFARFRGGRSVLTWAGGVCVLSPLAGLVAVGGFVAVTLTGSFAWGARLGVFAFPVVQLVVDGPHRVAATGALMSIIGLRFASHRRSSGSVERS